LVDPTGAGDVLGEYGDSGSLVAHYTYGMGLTSRVDASGGSTYYDFDVMGSTAGLSGTAGSYVARYSYLPFGESLASGGTLANPFRFVGQWGVMAAGSGLNFMRKRFYQPGLGSF